MSGRCDFCHDVSGQLACPDCAHGLDSERIDWLDANYDRLESIFRALLNNHYPTLREAIDAERATD